MSKPDPSQIQHAEQQWATANTFLDSILTEMREMQPQIEEKTGITDPSATFEYALHITGLNFANDPRTVVLACAAAITRLARQPVQADPLEEMFHQPQRGTTRND